MLYEVTESYYELYGSQWHRVSSETFNADEEFIRTILTDAPQPFESSHRLYKQAKGRHKYDTYETVSPEGGRKFVAFVDFSKAI